MASLNRLEATLKHQAVVGIEIGWAGGELLVKDPGQKAAAELTAANGKSKATAHRGTATPLGSQLQEGFSATLLGNLQPQCGCSQRRSPFQTQQGITNEVKGDIKYGGGSSATSQGLESTEILWTVLGRDVTARTPKGCFRLQSGHGPKGAGAKTKSKEDCTEHRSPSKGLAGCCVEGGHARLLPHWAAQLPPGVTAPYASFNGRQGPTWPCGCGFSHSSGSRRK